MASAERNAPPPRPPAPGRSAAALSFRKALQRLAEPLQPRPTRIGFRIAQAVASLFMLALPLCYFGFMVLVGLGIVYHAVAHFGLLAPPAIGAGVPARAAIVFMFLRWMLYFAPLVGGGSLLLSMIRPFFAPRFPSLHFTLPPGAAPNFVRLVHAVADAVGAPRPAEIHLTCECNAAAGPQRGLVSLARGKLSLNVGMPLIALLDIRELAGVLAHEFGHFNQRGAMVPDYIIQRVNFLFASASRAPDDIDSGLANAIGDSGEGALFILLARLVSGLGRLVTWCFALAGLLVSATMSRQMERDADRREVEVAGTDGFLGAMKKLVLGNFAQHIADGLVLRGMQEQRLPDDYIRLFEAVHRQIPEDRRLKMANDLAEGETGALDSHPCLRERCDTARAADDPGRVDSTVPARALFVDWAAMCRAVSSALYVAVDGNAALSYPRIEIDDLMNTLDPRVKALLTQRHGIIRTGNP